MLFLCFFSCILLRNPELRGVFWYFFEIDVLQEYLEKGFRLLSESLFQAFVVRKSVIVLRIGDSQLLSDKVHLLHNEESVFGSIHGAFQKRIIYA